MHILNVIQNLSKSNKLLILLFNDYTISFFALFISISLRIDTLIIDFNFYKNAFIIFPFLSVIFLYFFGTYNIVLRYESEKNIKTLFYSTLSLSILLILVLLNFDLAPIPRSISIIYPTILFVGLLLNRTLISYLLRINNKKKKDIKCILYGAGNAGFQTLNSLKSSNIYSIMGFIDDDVNKQGRKISGVEIYSFDSANSILENGFIDEVILTMPNIKSADRKKIIDQLSNFNLRVRSIPSIDDIISGKKKLFEINDLNLSDFIDRSIDLKSEEIKNEYNRSIIIVTGSGGSIGSELCRQLLAVTPKQLLILDHSELNLFNIHKELSSFESKTEIIPLLTSITDKDRLDNIFKTYNPNYVFHAAAYKHVHLVEENIVDGIKNNIVGSINIIDIAFKYKIKRFSLVSTDKAVDPSNAMGKTKRISELYLKMKTLQSKNEIESHVVRFGNVLGSSGSVFKIFSDQIRNGGPIQLTDKDVTRYFMTIPEAVGLILLSSTFSAYGEIYVLNMGKPIKILDLAKKMISLSGYSLKSEENPNGDIEIRYVGLKKGEKLHEKLAYSDILKPTTNKNILKANEKFDFKEHFQASLDKLFYYLEINDEVNIRKTLESIRVD